MATTLTEVDQIFGFLKESLRSQVPPLKVRKDDISTFEVAGTKPTMQGRQQVDGHYFASLVPKPKDVRLYFFPIYTHPEVFRDISPELQKYLKGKSCFHIKKLTPELQKEIQSMVGMGVKTYREAGII